MSKIYDNWERLVQATLKREHYYQLCHAHSRTPSISSLASSFPSPAVSIATAAVDSLSPITFPLPTFQSQPQYPKTIFNRYWFQIFFSFKPPKRRNPKISQSSSSSYDQPEKRESELRKRFSKPWRKLNHSSTSNSSFFDSGEIITSSGGSVIDEPSSSRLETSNNGGDISSASKQSDSVYRNIIDNRLESREEDNKQRSKDLETLKIILEDLQQKGVLLHSRKSSEKDPIVCTSLGNHQIACRKTTVQREWNIRIPRCHARTILNEDEVRQDSVFSLNTINGTPRNWMTNKKDISKPSFYKAAFSNFSRIGDDLELDDDVLQSMTGWGDITVDMSKMVSDIERLIFADLITGMVGDFASRTRSSLSSSSSSSRRSTFQSARANSGREIFSTGKWKTHPFEKKYDWLQTPYKQNTVWKLGVFTNPLHPPANRQF